MPFPFDTVCGAQKTEHFWGKRDGGVIVSPLESCGSFKCRRPFCLCSLQVFRTQTFLKVFVDQAVSLRFIPFSEMGNNIRELPGRWVKSSERE